jgi:hypothetical protein
MVIWQKLYRVSVIVFILLSLPLWLHADTLQAISITDKVRVFTRNSEFDYVRWTIQAFWDEAEQLTIDAPSYLNPTQERLVVFNSLALMRTIDQVEYAIAELYSDPLVTDPDGATRLLQKRFSQLQDLYAMQLPLFEKVLQDQISSTLVVQDLQVAGDVFPPVLFHISELPLQLIISPRDEIRQETAISIQEDFSLENIIALEQQVEESLDLSALIVPLGGVGVYPTMVFRSSDLGYLLEIIAHEWTHNYLTLRPLGWRYAQNPQLRSMNETTASICGKEISNMVLRRYYPELVINIQDDPENYSLTSYTRYQDDQLFDFRREMYLTRLEVDKLLSAGKVEEAEEYMEERREIFWENGYRLRRINQAYFAFYGAYADVPYGPAGEDPVGSAVRELRQRSVNLADFLNTMAGLTSFEELQQDLNSY